MQLSHNQQEALRKFFSGKPVNRAYVFGSYARNEARPESDIDLLVELDHSSPIGMKFFGYRDELEQTLHTRIDLVTPEGLSQYIKPYIEREKVLIYERAPG